MLPSNATKMSAFKFACHELYHGWRQFVLFLACLGLGVTVMALVNLFANVVETDLALNENSLLGGDVEVSRQSDQASPELQDYLSQYGQVSHIRTLRGMVRHQQDALLVELKAVDQAYPLLGRVQLNEDMLFADALRDDGLVVDPVILDQLAIQLGDVIQLGQHQFTVRATIKKEPDRIVQMLGFGPRVMLSQAALDQAQLISAGSLVNQRYRLLQTTPKQPQATLKATLETALPSRFEDQKWRVRTSARGNRGALRFVDQLSTYLMLAALATYLIAGIGIASSMQSLMALKMTTIAVLKSLGANRQFIFRTYFYLVLCLCLLGGMLGVVCAVLIGQQLLPTLATILPNLKTQSVFSITPVLMALWYGFLVALLFALHSLMSMTQVRPALLFRGQNISPPSISSLWRWLLMAGLGGLLVLSLLWSAQDWQLMLNAILMVLLTLFLFAGLVMVLRYLTAKLSPRKVWLGLAFHQLHRPGSNATMVVFAIGLSLSLLVTLNLTEQNINTRLKHILAEQAPDLFMLDVRASQGEQLRQLLQDQTQELVMVPMLRGYVTAINQVPVDELKPPPDMRWFLRGDRGLTYSAEQPINTRLTQGQWWPSTPSKTTLVSLDQRVLDAFDLALGDEITVTVLNQPITAKIANARKVDYASMQINFAIIFSAGELNHFPHTQVVAVKLKSTQQMGKLIRQITMQMPNISIIQTKTAAALFKTVLERVIWLLNTAALVSLIAALLVLISTLNASVQQRRYELALFKVLGARRHVLLKSCLAEWCGLALSSAGIAIGVGILSAWLLQQRFNAPDFYWFPEVVGLTLLLTLMVVVVVGILVNLRVFAVRPMQILRND